MIFNYFAKKNINNTSTKNLFGGRMKKAILIMAILFILAGAIVATANEQIPVPEQKEFFKEKSAVSGVGTIKILKKVLNKPLAIEAEEQWMGAGEFSMDSLELMNEGASTNQSADTMDPWNTTNYYEKKLIEFDGMGYGTLTGFKQYNSPSFYGGNGANVKEYFDTNSLQTEEWTYLKTTSKIGMTQDLVFNTMAQFNGTWGVQAEWKKPCRKEITHLQEFSGLFSVQKKLQFMEEVKYPPAPDP